MPTTIDAPKELTLADLKGKVDPDWCPGCGDFGVVAAVQKALVELQIPNHNVVSISGIGCSSNFPGFINTYGMHTLHGRALAVATGVKLANHDPTVLVTGGDGFGIGGNHFVHTMRRNVDLLYIVMDNQIYGLTTGQTSPTSRIGMKTKSMPFGNIEAPSTLSPSLSPPVPPSSLAATAPSRSTSPISSSRAFSTMASPSSTSSAPGLPITMTIPTPGSSPA